MKNKEARQILKEIVYLWASIKEDDKYMEDDSYLYELAEKRVKIEELLTKLAQDENFIEDLTTTMEAEFGDGISKKPSYHVKVEIKATREDDMIREKANN